MAKVNTENGQCETGFCDHCQKVVYLKVLDFFAYCTECGLTWAPSRREDNE